MTQQNHVKAMTSILNHGAMNLATMMTPMSLVYFINMRTTHCQMMTKTRLRITKYPLAIGVSVDCRVLHVIAITKTPEIKGIMQLERI
jgi:hypothetical protein